MSLDLKVTLAVWAVLSYPIWGSLIVWLICKFAKPRDGNFVLGLHIVFLVGIFGVICTGLGNFEVVTAARYGQSVVTWLGFIQAILFWILVGALIWGSWIIFNVAPSDETKSWPLNSLFIVGAGIASFLTVQILLWVFAFGNSIIQGILNQF